MKSTFLLFFLIPFIFHAQLKSGVVEYKVLTYRQSPISEVSTDEMKKLTYTLTFNEFESFFSVNDYKGIIDKTVYQNLLIASDCNETYYKDNRKSSYFMTANNSVTGEIMVEYPNHPTWELTQEEKKIAGYKCYKAVCFKKGFGPPGKPSSLKIFAWYCPSLAFSVGPKGLYGLPGLILEFEEPTRNIIFSASSVKLNPQESIVIKKPTSGKFLTEMEYRQIVQDWIDENYK